MIDEFELVKGLRPRVHPPTSEARRAAREALRQAIASDPHADPDPQRTGVQLPGMQHGARRLARRARGGTIRRPSLGGLASAALIVMTVVIAAGALILLGGHKPSTSASATAASSRRQLIDILGILRRPQTQADLGLPHDVLFPSRLQAAIQGAPDLPLVRLASVAPWGDRVFFIPMKPPGQRRDPLPRAKNRAGGGYIVLRRTETLDILVAPAGLGRGRAQIGGTGDITPAQIEAGNAWFPFEPGRPPKPGTTAIRTRLVVVVPDGVASVAFVFPRQGWPYTPIYASPLVVNVPVRDNIAAVETERPCCWESGPIMIWRGPGGKVIKRIGDLAAAYRVHVPGPETPLSRDAERDPSTPNPVSVSPSYGGRNTIFSIHFRVLVNDAHYRYSTLGPNRAGCFGAGDLSGGGGGSGGGPYDYLRGATFRIQIGVGRGRGLCPGTYHFSIAVASLGRRMLKHAAKPFGTATFTVRW